MPMRNGQLVVEPAVGALGAFVSGIDLSAPLPAPDIDDLRRLWLHYQVLFFRDQSLEPAQLMRVARAFGEPIPYPFLPGLAGHEAITVVEKRPEDRVAFGEVWHTDMAYLDTPPSATLLLARQTPAQGGDTLWASLYQAFDALSPALQAWLGTLTVINRSDRPAVSATRRPPGADAHRAPVLEAEHPLITRHPESGRPLLYLSPAHACRFGGMTDAESQPMIAWLAAHAIRPEFTCRLRWAPGTLALWDNRCCLHFPVNDYPGQARVMHRVTLA